MFVVFWGPVLLFCSRVVTQIQKSKHRRQNMSDSKSSMGVGSGSKSYPGNAGPQDRSYLCPYFHDEMRGQCPTPNCKINGSAQFRDDNKDKERGASKK